MFEGDAMWCLTVNGNPGEDQSPVHLHTRHQIASQYSCPTNSPTSGIFPESCNDCFPLNPRSVRRVTKALVFAEYMSDSSVPARQNEALSVYVCIYMDEPGKVFQHSSLDPF